MKRAKGSSRQIVGIISRCHQDQVQWMVELLTSDLSELVSEVKYFPITNDNSDEWKKKVEGCSIGILYHSLKHGRLNITDVEGSLYDKELLYMSQCRGKEHVMVVLDDLEQATEEETERILRTQPSIKHCSSLLLLIANKDKQSAFLSKIDAIVQLLNRGKHQSSMGSIPAKYSAGSTHGHHKQTLSSDDGASVQYRRKNSKLDIHCSQKHSVGVFSRCAKINYKWLVALLESNAFGSVVKQVHAVEISNDFSHFHSDVNNCTFAILYHSLTHGRLNITDVPDSLYDNVLKTLFQTLGKKKVIVVIDDLENSSAEQKMTILQEQASIKQYSQELLLFSETEKKKGMYLSDTMQDKLKELKQTLETSCDFTGNQSTTSVATECVPDSKGLGSDLVLEMLLSNMKQMVSNQTEELKKEISKQTRHIEDLKKEISNQNQHIEDLKKEISNQNQHIEDLKKDISNQTQQIEDLKKEISQNNQNVIKEMELDDQKLQPSPSNAVVVKHNPTL